MSGVAPVAMERGCAVKRLALFPVLHHATRFCQVIFDVAKQLGSSDLAVPPAAAALTMPRRGPDGQKKAYVRLTADYDALDVANRIGII